jgi:hypothetical protein
MAKKTELQPGQALPGQLEGPDTHFSTDKTTGVPHVDAHPGGEKRNYPKALYYKDAEGNVCSHVVESAEEHGQFSDHAESPAAFAPVDFAEESKAE